ncbi:MAG: hypothetical protein R2729_19425 [Bryobacteraceae bacterium]
MPVFLLLVSQAVALAAGWDVNAAARYIDARQEQWAAWKPAQSKAGGQCISCHTTLVHSLARAAIRRGGRQAQPLTWEDGVLSGIEKRLRGELPKTAGGAVDVILSAFLSTQTTDGNLQREAFERMWAIQKRDGPGAGAWAWYSLKLDPWESGESAFFGATIAAIAVGRAPKQLRDDARFRGNLQALRAFLNETAPRQPLHNKLMLAWASAKLSGLMSRSELKALREAALKARAGDGAWSIQSLGPWEFLRAEAGDGANAYATAFAAFALRQTPGGCRDKRIEPSLDWLRKHQDAASGAWLAPTMTKAYPAGSMQESFMNDAATGFAVLALSGEGCGG